MPLVLAFLVSVAIAPVLIKGLSEADLVRMNFAGRPVPVPIGLLLPLTAFTTLGIAAPLDRFVDDDVLTGPGLTAAMLYVVGVCLLGAIDDLIGSPASQADIERGGPRGLRGHARAAARGRFSTGAIKAIGAFGLAAFTMGLITASDFEYLLAVALVVLTTNLFNLLDLRPGRALKVFVVLAAALTIAYWEFGPLWAMGIFVGALPVLLRYDLAEIGMLGDTGSNGFGAMGGIWMVLLMDTKAQMIALALVALATIYGEFKSVSELIDRTPVLRFIDHLGRTRNAR